jgi:hypothetical protein
MEMGKSSALAAFDDAFVAAACLTVFQQPWQAKISRIARSALAGSLVFSCLISGALAQAAQDAQDAQQPNAIDPEYRKFDELVSFLRTRNAKQYAIPSPKGIDEAQFVAIGGIE